MTAGLCVQCAENLLDHLNIPLATIALSAYVRCIWTLGDRQNECGGVLAPIDVEQNTKKGYIIKYRCVQCGQEHNNKAAQDDSFQTILKVMNKTYQIQNYKTKK